MHSSSSLHSKWTLSQISGFKFKYANFESYGIGKSAESMSPVIYLALGQKFTESETQLS